MSFCQLMKNSSKRNGSNIVLALDLPPDKPVKMLAKARDILRNVRQDICAVKFNRHLVLPLSLFKGVRELVELAETYELPTIMDCKINDIGNTNQIIAEHYYSAGFKAVIANPFIGWEEGVQPIFQKAKKLDRGVILLVYMSHRGAWEGYGQQVISKDDQSTVPQYIVFAHKALQWNADGAVVGATYPDIIKRVYSILGDKIPIYSPGIGTQGGRIEVASQNGAKYLIVGRSITMAADPGRVVKRLNEVVARSLANIS